MHAITYRCLYHLIQYFLWNCGWKLSNFLPIEKSTTKAKSNRENAQLYRSNVGKICPKLHKNLISPFFLKILHFSAGILPILEFYFRNWICLSFPSLFCRNGKGWRFEAWCTAQYNNGEGGGVHMEREFKLLKLATTVAGHLSQLINFPKANMRKIFLV